MSAWWIALLASGCLNSFERARLQEPDAGVELDAGVEPDAGSEPDAGPACPDCRWVSLGATGTTTHVVDREGRMFGWGRADNGGLGVDVAEDSHMPLQVDGACWAHVRGGANSEVHSCAIDCSGALFCWGSNGNAEVGIGETTMEPITTPARVGAATDWLTTAGGNTVTCGIRSGGSLWCWGWKNGSRLGHEVTGNHATSPSRVPVERPMRALDVGAEQSCAIDDEDVLWCWGGTDGSSTDIFPPMRMHDGMTWREIASGYRHHCGIATDGSLWCFGDNEAGQLGVEGAPADPVRVGSANDWRHVSAGETHTCAIRGDRTMWCWGAGRPSGLAMDGTRIPPTQVGTRSDWDLLVAERVHTCASTLDGTLFCSGDALMNGQRGFAPVPTLVLVP